MYGHLYSPTKQPNTGIVGVPKFTSFFKQISFSFFGDSQPFETVF